MNRPLSTDNPIVIYGAGGATGRLILEATLAQRLPVALAGRGRASLEPLAAAHGLAIHTGDAADPAALAAVAAKASVLLNAAGPFSTTGVPLARAAIAGGAALVDVGGEVDVLVAQSALDDEARRAGVALICAAGYGVAVGDCLALHVAGRVGEVRRLRLGLDTYVGQRSPGAAQSTVAGLRRGNYEIVGGAMRRAGFADRPWRAEVDGERFLFAGAPLAEAWAAARTTGAADVRAGIRTRPAILPALRLAAAAASIGPVGRFMAARAARPAPVDASAAAADDPNRRSTVVAEAWGADGTQATAVLTLRREGYRAAAELAVAAARAVAGSPLSGMRTPAAAFGPDFVLGVDGAARRDLP